MMKHFTYVLLVLLLVLGGCSGSAGKDRAYGDVYTKTPEGLDYTVHFGPDNLFLIANLVDGLTEYDAKGNLVPALASSYKSEENGTVWTFTIRKGAKWMTADGEEYGEVTADDWVAGLQHALDAGSEEADLVRGVIKGAAEYMDGTADFHSVGIEALDRYTLVYTLEKPADFPALAVHGILYPVNREFFTAKSCTLGTKPDSVCRFGQTGTDGILYNGAYILSEFRADKTIALTRNTEYWDKKNVYPEAALFVYDDGTDPHFAMKKFEDGVTSYAVIRRNWFKDDYDSYLSKYTGYLLTADPDDSLHYLSFNFARQDEDESRRTADQSANVRKALASRNFRLAILTGFDRSSYLLPDCGDRELGNRSLRNTVVPAEETTAGEGSYSAMLHEKLDGTFFGEKDLTAGQDAFYDPALAKDFLTAASEEGITLPLTLDLALSDENPAMAHKAASFKNSVETSTNGQIQIRLVEAGQPYDLSLDHILRPAFHGTGAYLEPLVRTLCIDAPEEYRTQAEALSSLMAEAQSADSDELRKEKYAETEAAILSEALVIPVSSSDAEYYVSRTGRDIHPDSAKGMSAYRIKYVRVSELLEKAE